MIKIVLLGLLCFSTLCTLTTLTPYTYIGNSTIACNPSSTPKVTKGFATWFSDNVYACYWWNYKAKSTTACYAALNGVCTMDRTKFCDKCVLVKNTLGQSKKCKIIDFCDPSNCDFLDPGHLDILNNNNNANYKFLDKGKYVFPYQGAGGQPVITWSWTTC